MPTPDIERALAEGAARSRAVARSAPVPARTTGILGDRGRLAKARAWYRALPPGRRMGLVGLGLFLLLDIIAGLAAAASNGHF